MTKLLKLQFVARLPDGAICTRSINDDTLYIDYVEWSQLSKEARIDTLKAQLSVFAKNVGVGYRVENLGEWNTPDHLTEDGEIDWGNPPTAPIEAQRAAYNMIMERAGEIQAEVRMGKGKTANYAAEGPMGFTKPQVRDQFITGYSKAQGRVYWDHGIWTIHKHHAQLMTSLEAFTQVQQIMGLNARVGPDSKDYVGNVVVRGTNEAVAHQSEDEQLVEKDQTIDELKAQVAHFEEERKNLLAEAAKAEEQITAHDNTIGVLRAEKEEMETALSKAEDEVEELQSEVTELKNNMGRVASNLSNMSSSLRDITTAVQDMENEIDEAERIIE
jgi:archaellum component FlaC